jgi:hypothetical protein
LKSRSSSLSLLLDLFLRHLSNRKSKIIFLIQILSKSPFIRNLYYFSRKLIIYIKKAQINRADNNYELIKISKFLKKEAKKTILFKASSFEYIKPLVCGQNTLPSYKFCYKKKINAPEVYLVEIENAKIIGNSSLIFKDQKAIHNDLVNYKFDFTSEEYHCIYFVNARLNSIAINFNIYNKISIDKAATFVSSVAFNYAHFITEVLPGIIAFCKIPKYSSIPIVINDGLHPNIIKSISLIVGSRPVILLPKLFSIDIKQLYVVSASGYVPFEPRPEKIRVGAFPIIFNSNALKYTRNFYLSKILKRSQPIKKLPEKIFIRRNSNVRLLRNSFEIENFFKKNGFTIVNLGNEPFETQVALFAGAKIIAGPIGADFANLLFVNSNCHIILLSSNQNDIQFPYWPSIVSFLNIKIKYCLGDIVNEKSFGKGVHSDFCINQEYLNDQIQKLR